VEPGYISEEQQGHGDLEYRIRQARILMVDDEPVNLKLLEKMLSADGYVNIHTLTDSREVEAAYEREHYDLILLDINMPHLDGFDVMARLKGVESDGYLPVLVLTAQADRQTRLRALEAGARDFLSKPLDRAEVLNRIRNILEVRLLHKDARDQNRILEEKVQERTHELYETQLEVIRRLGRAAEYRDNETGLHIIRMSKFSQLIGEKAGMSEQDTEMLLNASPMHDIGKIGIPDSILLKPGKLDAEEWKTMQTHTSIGAEILSGHSSPLLIMAREIALTHHEKWDGTGYPEGRRGTDIPLVGRIVAVADVFDALTSERPYKKAWPVEDAVRYINEQAGRHFDPDLVKVFHEVLKEVLEIKERYAEPGIALARQGS